MGTINYEDVIISHQSVSDTIILEGEYSFDVKLDIGLDKMGDFYLKIVIENLDELSFKRIIELGELPQALSITSSFITNEEFDITHIVVCDVTYTSNLSVVWECLSDKPTDMNFFLNPLGI